MLKSIPYRLPDSTPVVIPGTRSPPNLALVVGLLNGLSGRFPKTLRQGRQRYMAWYYPGGRDTEKAVQIDSQPGSEIGAIGTIWRN